MISEFPRWTYFLYFFTHIPITICIDLQGVLGSLVSYPETLVNLFNWYIKTHNDFLMRNPPIWLKSFLICEALFQLPFFFIASYALYTKKNFIRIPMIIYCSHVATTVIPILSEFYFSEELTNEQRSQLVLFYIPYLIVPLCALFQFTFSPIPFDEDKPKRKRSTKNKKA